MVPVKVQVKDTKTGAENNTHRITPVVPTSEPATSTDIQGKTQIFLNAIPDDDVPAATADRRRSLQLHQIGVPEKFTGEGTV